MGRYPDWYKERKYTKEFCDAEADALIEYMDASPLPMLKEFCSGRNYLANRVPQMCKESEKFKIAVEALKQKEETQIVRGGLGNKLNPTMSIFCLKNNHGWRDKVEVDQTSNVNITNEFLPPVEGTFEDKKGEDIE